MRPVQIYLTSWTYFISKTFIPNAHVGLNVDAKQLQSQFDSVVIATGATWPRDLKIPNREADGIHFAMEYLQVNFKSNHS